jgi:antirestriction protein ArdC
MTPSEAIASKYARIFSELFDRISGDWTAPWSAGGPFPQQNMEGDPYRGTNALLTSVTATARGFALPVWLTFPRASELGLHVRDGERSIPVVKYDFWYRERESGRRVPGLSEEQFALLPKERQDELERRCTMHWSTVFNLSQTDFREAFPVQYGELLDILGTREPRKESLEVLDRMVANDGWLCPVCTADVPEPAYLERFDRIDVPPKERFPDESRYYVTLLHEMIHSTGSEERLDRSGLSSALLGERAREELVAELGAATLGTLAGLEPTIRKDNLQYLKAWSSAISRSPEIIYMAVSDASRAADLASRHLGLEQAKGFDLGRILNDIDRERTMRKDAVGKRSGHRPGWNPVKAPRRDKGLSI